MPYPAGIGIDECTGTDFYSSTCPLNSGVYEWYSMGWVGNVLCIDRVSGGIHI